MTNINPITIITNANIPNTASVIDIQHITTTTQAIICDIRANIFIFIF